MLALMVILLALMAVLLMPKRGADSSARRHARHARDICNRHVMLVICNMHVMIVMCNMHVMLVISNMHVMLVISNMRDEGRGWRALP